MSDREALLSLASRCEALGRPCRSIDVEIAVAVDWRWPDWEEGESTAAGQAEKHGLDWLINRCINGYSSPWRHIPEYSASMDSAMSLLPEGWQTLAVEQSHDGAEWIWRLYPQYRSDLAVFGQAGSAALALTAASLRTLAQPTVPQP